MNYGKKFLHILIAGFGMFICITGISYKTGYFPGHSEASALLLLIIGGLLTLYGLYRLSKD